MQRMDAECLDEMFASVWIQQIQNGNFQFFREMLDRTEGRLAAVTEATNEEEIDWSDLDNECDTPARSTDPKGV